MSVCPRPERDEYDTAYDSIRAGDFEGASVRFGRVCRIGPPEDDTDRQPPPARRDTQERPTWRKEQGQ